VRERKKEGGEERENWTDGQTNRERERHIDREKREKESKKGRLPTSLSPSSLFPSLSLPAHLSLSFSVPVFLWAQNNRLDTGNTHV
jgi:hypothetical protein